MIIAIAVGAGACPMNLTFVFLLFILSIHIIAGLGIDSFDRLKGVTPDFDLSLSYQIS